MIPQNTSPFHPGDKIVAYCRYSGGEEQGLKDTSTDEQEAAIRRYCEQNGLELVKVYADPEGEALYSQTVLRVTL